MRRLEEDAGAVARVLLRPDRAAVLEVHEHRERLLDDVVRGAPLHVHDEAEAAGVVLVLRGRRAPAAGDSRSRSSRLRPSERRCLFGASGPPELAQDLARECCFAVERSAVRLSSTVPGVFRRVYRSSHDGSVSGQRCPRQARNSRPPARMSGATVGALAAGSRRAGRGGRRRRPRRRSARPGAREGACGLGGGRRRGQAGSDRERSVCVIQSKSAFPAGFGPVGARGLSQITRIYSGARGAQGLLSAGPARRSHCEFVVVPAAAAAARRPAARSAAPSVAEREVRLTSYLVVGGAAHRHGPPGLDPAGRR